VDWQPCAGCGEPVPLRPPPELPVHVRCKRAHRRAYLAARYRANPAAQREASKRWKERDPAGFTAMMRACAQRKKARHPEAFAAELDRLKAYGEAQQERTATAARRVKVPWSDEEDAVVLATLDRPLAEVAIDLGRTWYATAKRRTLLRRRAETG
jgi:hypothetical protein